MSTVACKLYRITFPEDKALEVVSQIELANVIEPVEPLIPINTQEYSDRLNQLNQDKEKTAAAIGTLTNYHPNKKNKKIILSDKLIGDLQQNHHKYQSTINQIREITLKKAHLEKENTKLEQEIESFQPYQDITDKLFSKTELFNTKIVAVTGDNLKILKRKLAEIESVSYHKVAQTEEVQLWALVYSPELESAVVNVISSKKLAQLHPSAFTDADNPEEILQHLNDKLEANNQQIDELTQQLKQLSEEYLTKFQALYDLLDLQITSIEILKYVGYVPGETIKKRDLTDEAQQVVTQASQTETSLVSSLFNQEVMHIDGWIDPDKVSDLKKQLNRVTDEVELKVLSTQDDPEVRVVLKNNRLFRPFEVITSLMGTPGPDEPDPSPYVAPFFIGFFGFALGDAGYGIVMLLTSLYLLTKVSREDLQIRNGVKLLLYCGISTIFFGIITGSWFGANLNEAGQLGETLRQFQLIDLQNSIITVLMGSLVIGFIHQLFGLILKFSMLVNNGKTRQAFEDPGSWLLLLTSFVSLAITRTMPNFVEWQDAANILGLISLAWFVYGQGSGAKYWFVRPFKGLAGLFNLTSYLSNTLSYARLLALALATGVIASVVNLIAVMFSPDVPVVGFLVTALILIAGHSFNIGLNLMGTFINVARLHLVEFFPRFFEAKGILLRPLKIQTNYSKLAKNLQASDLSWKN